MILQPVSSIFPCSPLPSGTCQTPDLSISWCCLPTSSSVCLVFFLLSLCLARWFGQTWWTGDMTIPLQFASLYYGQEVIVWSLCPLDLGMDFERLNGSGHAGSPFLFNVCRRFKCSLWPWPKKIWTRFLWHFVKTWWTSTASLAANVQDFRKCTTRIQRRFEASLGDDPDLESSNPITSHTLSGDNETTFKTWLLFGFSSAE